MEGRGPATPPRGARRSGRTSSRANVVVDEAVIRALPPELVPFMHRDKEARYAMDDPVVAKDGHTYEREAIEAYIEQHGRSPIVTDMELTLDHLIENRAVQSQIDEYRSSMEHVLEFQRLSGAGQIPALSQTLEEADALAARQLFQEAGSVYSKLIDGLAAQMSVERDPNESTALESKMHLIKDRLAGVQEQEAESLAVGLSLPGRDSSSSDLGAPEPSGLRSPPISIAARTSSGRGRESTDEAAMLGAAAGGPKEWPDGLEDMLTECAQHNHESEGDEPPTKEKSMWLKYNAGKRRGQWREVWPFNDSAVAPWLSDGVGSGAARYFRGMEADHIDVHHGRTTKYMLSLVTDVSEDMPEDYDPDEEYALHATSSTASLMTDDGERLLGQSPSDRSLLVGSPQSQSLLDSESERSFAPEPEPEPQLDGPAALRLTPSRPSDHELMSGSARELLRHHELADHVADLLEQEDIRTPQTLVDLDEKMVDEHFSELKVGEKIKLKKAINFAKRYDRSSARADPAESPQVSGLQESPQDEVEEAAYTEAYEGFNKASEIQDVGEIEVLEYLSKGTSGTVCKAQWKGMRVAVKRFYYVEEDEELLRSFENEVFLMRELHHSNLVRFFAAQCKPPDLCIVMELMRGNIADLLYGKLSKGSKETVKSKQEAVIVKGIAAGMLFLHDHGVCHRDLKSANVLFGNRLSDVKLCDFAFSKFKQHASMSAKFETSVGTPAWMAPEVLRGDEYTLLADVYSFGVILWEIVQRKAPFEDLNRFQIIFQVGTQAKLLDVPEGTPPLWEAIIASCWRKSGSGSRRAMKRPGFKQIVEVVTLALEEVQGGASLEGGAGYAAWEAAERARAESEPEPEPEPEPEQVGLAPLRSGIAEDPAAERQAALEDAEGGGGLEPPRVEPADPDASTPLARTQLATPRTRALANARSV